MVVFDILTRNLMGRLRADSYLLLIRNCEKSLQ
jgi:hypothetical protein